MKLKIVHFVIDDKFIDGAISLFEADDRVENTYVIIGQENDCQHIKYKGIQFVDYEDALDFINTFNVVIFHSLPAIPINIVKDIKNDVKVVWFAWGYDIYEDPYDVISIRLLGKVTKRNTRLLRIRKYFDWRYWRSKYIVLKHLRKVLERIDYFSGVFPYEIEMIKSIHKEFKAEPIDFYYGSTDFFIPEEPSKEIRHNKQNIIIGNSANMTGNHLDVLTAMSSVKIDKEAKIILPLSYCGSPSYINLVDAKAEELAHGQIIALKTYLPFNEYIALISNCRTAVFAHERQQASDNIFMQLLYGARVYMSEKSAAYDYLRSIGLKVFSLQKDMDMFNKELSDEEVMLNRTILSSYYSSSKLIERVKIINSKLIKATCCGCS